MLRFIETRFASSGVTVPNLTPWRRSVTGDLTATLNLAKPPNLNVPTLPQTIELICATTQFPVPDPQVMPRPSDKTPVRPGG